jgi:hypothetical protein
VLYRGKQISFFAKGGDILIVDIEQFDPFEPKIFGGNALLPIDPEWLL